MAIINSLGTRLIILFISLLLLILLSFSWFVSESSSQFQFQATQALHQDLASHMIKENKLLSEGEIDAEAIEHLFHSLMLLGPAFEIYIVDLDGKILAFSAVEGKVKRQRINIDNLTEFITGEASFPIFGDDPRHVSRQKIFSAATLFEGEVPQAYLYVIIGSELQDKIFSQLVANKTLAQSLAILLGLIVFALVASIIIILAITKPLRALSGQVVDYHQRQGWRDALMPYPEKLQQPRSETGEVEQLQWVITDMAATIASQFNQLSLVDQQRKELLAYISHDLRTPLASLTGYLETWQRQQTPDNLDANAQYIEIALRNAGTLNTLVEQVFELAHLETGCVTLSREPVAIAELTQDIIDSFALSAQRAGVILTVTPKDSSIQVDADIAKLERVLGNLVANALHHTPAGGHIVISFKAIEIELQARILIRVTDTGSGISREELPRVFEAHFRAANKSYNGSGNVGLGLAIVKALLALHQSDIEVTSVEQQGTTFSFSLPQYSLKY